MNIPLIISSMIIYLLSGLLTALVAKRRIGFCRSFDAGEYIFICIFWPIFWLELGIEMLVDLI